MLVVLQETGKNTLFSCGAHPASYPVDTGGSFLKGRVVRAWSWPLTSTQCWG